jgi:Mor family transcriptional regulator
MAQTEREDEMSNSELSAFIDEWVTSKRNREILKERLIDGIKISELAEKYELSDRQVKTIIKKFKSILP